MEPGLVLLTSTVLLAIAAAGGLLMAGMRFVGDRSPPAALAMLHGFLAAAAVSLLLYAAATVGLPRCRCCCTQPPPSGCPGLRCSRSCCFSLRLRAGRSST